MGPRTIRTSRPRAESDKTPASIEPLSWCCLRPRHLSRFVAEYRSLRVRPSGYVALDDTDRVVAEDFRERREVDPLLSHACRESVTEIAENQIQGQLDECDPDGSARKSALIALAREFLNLAKPNMSPW